MECAGLMRSARIPIEFVANSASSSRKQQADEHQLRQNRHHRQRLQQQQLSRVNHASSSVNGAPSLSRHTADTRDTVLGETETAQVERLPLSLVRDRRPRQRTCPTRARAGSESRPTPASGMDRRSRTTLSEGNGEGSLSGNESEDDVVSRTGASLERSPGQNITIIMNSWNFCDWGTAAAAPPPFRLGDPAFCGSRPLVSSHPLLV